MSTCGQAKTEFALLTLFPTLRRFFGHIVLCGKPKTYVVKVAQLYRLIHALHDVMGLPSNRSACHPNR